MPFVRGTNGRCGERPTAARDSHNKSWALDMELHRQGFGTARSARPTRDRKSTRLNSSHQIISYAVFCLKKKKRSTIRQQTLRRNLQNTTINGNASTTQFAHTRFTISTTRTTFDDTRTSIST